MINVKLRAYDDDYDDDDDDLDENDDDMYDNYDYLDNDDDDLDDDNAGKWKGICSLPRPLTPRGKPLPRSSSSSSSL